MAWLLFAQSEGPDPILPQNGSGWDWLLPVGVVLGVALVLTWVVVYLVRTRRLAAQAIAEVHKLSESTGQSNLPS